MDPTIMMMLCGSMLILSLAVIVLSIFGGNAMSEEYEREQRELPPKQKEWDNNYEILYDQIHPVVKTERGWTDCFDTFDLIQDKSKTLTENADPVCRKYSKTYDKYVIKENTKSDSITQGCVPPPNPDGTPRLSRGHKINTPFLQILCERSESASKSETKERIIKQIGQRPVSKFAGLKYLIPPKN